MKKLLLSLVILSSAATTNVFCNESTTITIDQALDDLLGQLKIKESLKATVPFAMQQYTKNISTKDQAALEKAITEVTRYLGSDKFFGKIKSLYKKHFTTKEVLNITEFYKSETGKKFTALAPQLSMEMGQLMAQDMQDLITDIQKNIDSSK